MAQLKLGYDHHSANAKFRFHGANVVAQLKPRIDGMDELELLGFHGEMLWPLLKLLSLGVRAVSHR